MSGCWPCGQSRAIAVIGGQGLLRFINIRTLRIVTAVVLFALAGFAGWEASASVLPSAR